ncbi:pseudouridine synthase deg1 [Basidiobolus ranarum]|uniref:Pseudouridine synthase deg1 n=1 Tax=Basidiobolus ranarum TaxID=34480 RepID=A0ABR2WUG7_9FUNG
MMSRLAKLTKPLIPLLNTRRIFSFTRYRSMSTSGQGGYDSWSKEKLIEKLLQYEKREQTPTVNASSAGGESSLLTTFKRKFNSSGEPIKSKKKKKNKYGPKVKRNQRPFDITKYPKRHIALKVAYFGWDYYGFASQGENGTVETVEDQLFRALLGARLIADPLTCNYSRCGRTDKGVSGLGQVIALDIRSNIPQGDDVQEGGAHIEEIGYIDTINKQLPKDVRVIAWSPVEDTFNARFDCRWRKYKYYFPRGTLNIEKMLEGAKLFLGTHDFRNFCKIDAAKQIYNYERTILDVDIRKMEGVDFPSPELEFYELNLTGTAFLWHQVRCMMAILFNIGQGLEEPSLVQKMLDVDALPSKPNYEMASDLPLVLFDCHFDKIDWQFDNKSSMIGLSRLHKHVLQQWNVYTAQSMMFTAMYKELGSLAISPPSDSPCKWSEYVAAGKNKSVGTNIVLGAGRGLRVNTYIPMLERPRQEPFDILNARYSNRRQPNAEASD